VLQRAYRPRFRQRAAAAVRLQAALRGWLARARLRRERAAALLIQVPALGAGRATAYNPIP
jgi:hypothetical protein